MRGQGSKYQYKLTIIGPPAKRHLNGVSLTADDGPSLNADLLRNPIFVIFQGEG